MKLKHGKKYETADGVVFRVNKMSIPIDDLTFESSNCFYNDFGEAIGIRRSNDLIRRHYTKPKPAHKLDLKPGDVAELVAWEDGITVGIGNRKTVGINSVEVPSSMPKGQRPLFKVVSRA